MILYVKQTHDIEGGGTTTEWVPIPSVQGYNVYFTSPPTRFDNSTYFVADPQPLNDSDMGVRQYYIQENDQYVPASTTQYTSGVTYYIKRAETGWTWTLYSDKSRAESSSYAGETMVVYDGASGIEITVDNVSPVLGNIPVEAVRYGAAQSLGDAQKATARNNIDAMQIVSANSTSTAIQFITYNTTTSQWQASELNSYTVSSADISALFT